MNGVTTLLEEVVEEFKYVELPPHWTLKEQALGAYSDTFKDGYLIIFSTRSNTIVCITDVQNQGGVPTPGSKGPLAIEKNNTDGWVLVCDADTPKQIVDAFMVFLAFGEFK